MNTSCLDSNKFWLNSLICLIDDLLERLVPGAPQTFPFVTCTRIQSFTYIALKRLGNIGVFFGRVTNTKHIWANNSRRHQLGGVVLLTQNTTHLLFQTKELLKGCFQK